MRRPWASKVAGCASLPPVYLPLSPFLAANYGAATHSEPLESKRKGRKRERLAETEEQGAEGGNKSSWLRALLPGPSMGCSRTSRAKAPLIPGVSTYLGSLPKFLLQTPLWLPWSAAPGSLGPSTCSRSSWPNRFWGKISPPGIPKSISQYLCRPALNHCPLGLSRSCY